MSKYPFVGRTLQLVRDLSIDEQRYLYKKAAEYKKAFYTNDTKTLENFKIAKDDFTVYLLFQENSTRTKESFLNAAKFHDVRVNNFMADASSFSKKESITDTVRMLMGYSRNTCFVVRTSYEGTCKWLDTVVTQYAEKTGMPKPFCINAGDGRHEHPTQELLDEFSFIELLQGDPSHIHIALIGDLFHGRTVHSKTDGLKIFNEVQVDLVAPPEIAMPKDYVTKMKEQGFEIRVYESIDEYVSQKAIAPLWYFTRLQQERMGEKLLRNIDDIAGKISFNKTHLPQISLDVKFFHPLPRNKTQPTIPSFLDNTLHNQWDMQAMNGYYVRVALLSMLSGTVGEDFEGQSLQVEEKTSDFIEDITVQGNSGKAKPVQNFGIKPIENGVVIDHIGLGDDPKSIWNKIDVIRRVLNYNTISSHGVFESLSKKRFKGIISIPDLKIDSRAEFKKIGAISSGCTINIIQNSCVIQKMRVSHPHRIYNFTEIDCKNKKCISHSDHNEPVVSEFRNTEENENIYTCIYCETTHSVSEIWNF